MVSIYKILTLLLVSMVASSSAFDPTSASSQLGSLEFGKLLGNPLHAVVQAMQASAEATVQFIVNVGLEEVRPKYSVSSNDTVYHIKTVDFYYESILNGNTTQKKMEMPFLYLVPTPYLQIESVSITLNVEMNSVFNRNTTTEKQCTGSLARDPRCQLSGFYGIPTIYGAVSTKTQEKTSLLVQKKYHLDVALRAGSAPLPGGMSRVLDLFEAITRSSLPGITRPSATDPAASRVE
jgi:hypothetical protein